MPLTHTRLLVTHFAACFRFYRDALQMRPTWGDEADSYASFTQGQADNGHVLAIFRRESMSEAVGTTHLPLESAAQDRFMLIVEVANVDAEVERIRSLSVEILQEPRNFPDWGYRGAYLRDPDGNLIELSCGLPEEDWSDGLQDANQKWQAQQDA